jgi:hypothetical protein
MGHHTPPSKFWICGKILCLSTVVYFWEPTSLKNKLWVKAGRRRPKPLRLDAIENLFSF